MLKLAPTSTGPCKDGLGVYVKTEKSHAIDGDQPCFPLCVKCTVNSHGIPRNSLRSALGSVLFQGNIYDW